MRITPLATSLRRFKSTLRQTPTVLQVKSSPNSPITTPTPPTTNEEDGIEMVRHKPLVPLTRPRELILACTSMRSNVNLSAIARNSGCAGVEKMIVAGPDGKIVTEVARNSSVQFSFHQSLAPQIKKLKKEGYSIVALEQTKTSACIYDFKFNRKTALVIGNERTGIPANVLELVDHVIEIPVYGLPYSHNVAQATAIATYEYCRQFPNG